MARLSYTYKPFLVRIGFFKISDVIPTRLLPRRCMLVSVGLVLAGLGIPLLIVLQLLPASLLLGFMGFALSSIGGVLALVFCGEM